MTFVSVFVNSNKWASVAQLALSAYLTFIVCKYQPMMYGWVNHVRVGSYASVTWCAVIYLVLAFGLGESQHALVSLHTDLQTASAYVFACDSPSPFLPPMTGCMQVLT
jgi:hypothetical protein